MANTFEDRGFHKRIQRIEGLISALDQSPDSQIRDQTREIIQAIFDLHGKGLEKILEHINEAGPAGDGIVQAMSSDDLISSLFLLYGIHPLSLETRVEQALDKAREGLRLHGGNVQLLGIEEGVVRLRLEGNCNGCPSSAATLRSTIEEAIYEKAPDIAGIEVEQAPEKAIVASASARVALPLLHA